MIQPLVTQPPGHFPGHAAPPVHHCTEDIEDSRPDRHDIPFARMNADLQFPFARFIFAADAPACKGA